MCRGIVRTRRRRSFRKTGISDHSRKLEELTLVPATTDRSLQCLGDQCEQLFNIGGAPVARYTLERLGDLGLVRLRDLSKCLLDVHNKDTSLVESFVKQLRTPAGVQRLRNKSHIYT